MKRQGLPSARVAPNCKIEGLLNNMSEFNSKWSLGPGPYCTLEYALTPEVKLSRGAILV